MTTPQWMTDPEMAGLVAEIAADPRSSLFRHTPRAWKSRGDQLRVGYDARCTSAEAKLRETYHEHLAFLLRRAFSVLAAESESGRRNFGRRLRPGDPLGPWTEESVRACLRSTTGQRQHSSLPPHVMDVIEPLVGRSSHASISLWGLQGAATLLAPNPISRIHAGIAALIMDNDLDACEHLSAAVAVTLGSGDLASIAWTNAAHAASTSGRHAQAARYAHRATEADGEHVAAWMQRLISSSRVEDAMGMHAAAEFICEHLPADSADLEEALMRRELTGGITCSSYALTFERVRSARLGEAARRLLGVPIR